MAGKGQLQDNRIRLIVDLSDSAHADAFVRSALAMYGDISILRPQRDELPQADAFLLSDCEDGIELKSFPGEGVPEGGQSDAFAYFPRGARVSTVFGRIREISGSAECEPPREAPASGAKCIAFIASGGGIGTTLLAKTLGRLALRDLGERCLYISLAPYGAASPGGAANSLTRLLYRLMSGDVPDMKRFCTEQRGVFVIANRGFNPESGNISPEILEKLSASAGASGFGYLLLDIGNHLEKDRLRILESCSGAVSLSREGCGPVRAACGGRIVDAESFCSQKAAGSGPIRFTDMGRIDETDPPPEYCEAVRRIMGKLGIGIGEGTKEKSRGKAGLGVV